MRAVFQYRQWFFSFALAVPIIFLPHLDYSGLHSTYWGIGFVDIHVGGDDDGHILHFQDNVWWLWFLLSVVLWTLFAMGAWQARLSAVARTDWLGAIVQAFLTSFYCSLMFVFLYGLIQLIWFWQLYSASWPEIKHAFIVGRLLLPYLYAIGITGVFVALFLDSRLRQGFQRTVHLAFAIFFIFCIAQLAPFVAWQLDSMDEVIINIDKWHK